MKVVEIFKSIEGEGIRSGAITTFIRFYGCNCRCSYCDTKYSYENSEYTEMSIGDILETCQKLETKNITITGGEPLIQDDICELLLQLLLRGYSINVETNGTIDVSQIKAQLLKMNNLDACTGNLFFTIDYKCNSSGMSDKMDVINFCNPSSKNVYKFVVGNIDDLIQMKHIVTNNFSRNVDYKIYVSPLFNEIAPKEIVEYLIDNNLNNVRLQLQLHKIVWPPDMRGV